MSKMIQELKKKKKGVGSGKDVLGSDESLSHMDPVYKNAKMSVLSDIANMAGKSMGEDLKNHKSRKSSMPGESHPGEADSHDALKMMMAGANAEGHDKDSMDMLDADQEDDHVHGTDAPSEMDHKLKYAQGAPQRYAKGGRVGDVLGKHNSPHIVDWQAGEEDADEGEEHGKGFDFGKQARSTGSKHDELYAHDGLKKEHGFHPEEEDGKENNEDTAKKYGKGPHEYEPSHEDSDDELVGMSDEDIKMMMDHLDSKLKSRSKK